MKYDAIVIGSGQGGTPLAHKLADRNWKVALIEREHLGGSCINYGCTPTKTMIASARIAHYARRGPDFGVHTRGVKVDLAEVVARKDRIVLNMRQGQEGHVEKRPALDLYRGHGRFTGPQTVAVTSGDDEQKTLATLTAGHIFINTGARPRILDLPGLDEIEYLTNRNVIHLAAIPEHLLVLGGSYLGLEFGQMFRRFGSRVTVIEVNEQITPKEDSDVAEALQEALTAEGMEFRLGATATAVARRAAGLDLTIQHQDERTETLTASHLLLAVGRAPNTEELGLDAAGIETDDQGYVQVNDKLETNVAGVYAIGDVKGGPAFTHISYDDHLVIFDNLIHGRDESIANRIVPYALFTDPELGRVGLTEKAAREAGYDLKLGKIPMEAVARARERGEAAGLMKVVVNAADDRILGAAILGPEGGELVQALMVLMMADAPWTVLKKGTFIHPTLTEGFFSLMDKVE